MTRQASVHPWLKNRSKQAVIHVATRTLRRTFDRLARVRNLRVGPEVGANSSSTSIMGSWNEDTPSTDSALDDLRSMGQLSGRDS